MSMQTCMLRSLPSGPIKIFFNKVISQLSPYHIHRPRFLLISLSLHRFLLTQLIRWAPPLATVPIFCLVGTFSGSLLCASEFVTSSFEQLWDLGERVDPGTSVMSFPSSSHSSVSAAVLIPSVVWCPTLPDSLLPVHGHVCACRCPATVDELGGCHQQGR
jgi:hypothetical protein